MTGEAVERFSTIAPAKVNLTLRVVGKRTDGYHDIESVVTQVTLYDGIDIGPSVGCPIQIRCLHPDVPTDARNLMWQVVERLAGLLSHVPATLIQLHKRIPVAAGLGGGSSDAAALLRLLNRTWQLGLNHQALHAFAEQIGSDVPLFLHPGTVYMTGRGESIEPLPLVWDGWLVLIMPPLMVSTAKVYDAWHASAGRRVDARTCLATECSTAEDLDEVLFNDLEGAVFQVEPRLKELKSLLEEHTHRRFHVSGSGSTLYACSDDFETARQLAERVTVTTRQRTQVVRALT